MTNSRALPSDQAALLLVGTDHRCSPLALRERVAYNEGEGEELLVHLIAHDEVAEAYLLSTCNRTELYLQPRDEQRAYRLGLDLAFLARASEMQEPGRLYVKRNSEAARHLLAVAAGLESMILGEPEILGQVKQAVTMAEALGASGTFLRRLLRSAVTAGKRARSESAIGSGAVSLGYAVVELAKNIFKELEACAVVIVGAGETGSTVARNLLERGALDLTVINRTLKRAQHFQAQFPGTKLVEFERLAEGILTADVVVTATSSLEPVLTRENLANAMRRRKAHRPLLAVDLGVPRDIETEARELENLFLHDMDSLEHLIARNLKRRREEVPRVEAIVEEELYRFHKWYRGLKAEPVVALLQRRAEEIRRREVAVSLTRFPDDTHDDLERLTRSLVRKILHHPSTRLRSGAEEESLPHLDLVRDLFALDDEESEA